MFGKKFHNVDSDHIKFSSVLRWICTHKFPKWPKWVDNHLKPKIIERVNDSLKITYINHSTFLIQMAGLNILTDPIWSKTASPFKTIGPRRVHAPGIAFDDLPIIDIVLISHVHYDHLDVETVKKLNDKFSPLFITGLNVSKHLRKIDKSINVKELNWWEKTKVKNLDVFFTPAKHWSNRNLFIKNKMLWGSFIIQHKKSTIYFAGDTAWSKHFSQIANEFAPITVALLPIGAYEPRWFMKHNHIDPKEALLAHHVLKSKFSIAMHFNCFKNLADDKFDEPKNVLQNEIKSNPKSIEYGDFVTPLPGQEYVNKINK